MSDCPCCSNQMLRHVRSHQVHWFCRHCWQEMPHLDSAKSQSASYSNQLSSVYSLNSISRRVSLGTE